MLVSGCLSVSAAAGSLQELRISTVSEAVHVVPWLPQLTLLTRLEGLDLHECPPDATELVHMQNLPLKEARFVSLAAAVRLQPSLTALHLSCNQAIPEQLSQLTSLARLEIMCRGAEGAELDAALLQLTALTCLAVVHRHAQTPSLPPYITTLRSLRRLMYDCRPITVDLGLPQGPWLCGVEWLGLPWGTLELNVDMLQAAASLRHLCCFGAPEMGNCSKTMGQWPAFWDGFVVAHPPLRSLAIENFQQHATIELVDALLDVRDRRPGLRVRQLDAGVSFKEVASVPV